MWSRDEREVWAVPAPPTWAGPTLPRSSIRTTDPRPSWGKNTSPGDANMAACAARPGHGCGCDTRLPGNSREGQIHNQTHLGAAAENPSEGRSHMSGEMRPISTTGTASGQTASPQPPGRTVQRTSPVRRESDHLLTLARVRTPPNTAEQRHLQRSGNWGVGHQRSRTKCRSEGRRAGRNGVVITSRG